MKEETSSQTKRKVLVNNILVYVLTKNVDTTFVGLDEKGRSFD